MQTIATIFGPRAVLAILALLTMLTAAAPIIRWR